MAGTGGYVGGIFVWTDYPYDDRGANADAAIRRAGDPLHADRSMTRCARAGMPELQNLGPADDRLGVPA